MPLKEFHGLVDNAEVETETKWKFLQRHDITTDDVRAWFNFLMYTGCRFPEAVLVHSDPAKYDGRGILRIPNYKGKEMRSIKARNIFLSYKGREVIKDFFESQQMPSETYKDVVDAMRALTVILHESGKTIGLPEQTFTLRRKRKRTTLQSCRRKGRDYKNSASKGISRISGQRGSGNGNEVEIPSEAQHYYRRR